MLLKDILTEAVYPGNVGAMEVYKFYKTASEDQKQDFEELLDRKEYNDAWEMVQDITSVRLHRPDNTQPH